ncbi:MFS transporter [Microbacterium sp. MC2]
MRGRPSAGIVLPFVIFWSTLDRSLILPLIPAVAGDLEASVALTTTAITTHAIAYAALQLLWGPLSTRWGRIRVLWVSTSIAALACTAAALAPDITVFLIARTLSGGAFAATFAAVLTYFGDTLPLARRPAAMSNLATATALALAAGTLVSGAVVAVIGWRAVFGGYAIVTAALVPLLASLREAPDAGARPLRGQLIALARSRWALVVCVLVAVEGVLLIGFYNLLPVALQQTGADAFTAGGVTAAFGVAVVVVSQVMKLAVGRISAAVFLAAGGVLTTAAMGLLAVTVSPVSVLVAATLMGTGWALAHTTLQTWMTDAAVDSRALGMTLFSISLMMGGAVGAGVGTAPVAGGAFTPLFAMAAVLAAVFGAAAFGVRRRYREREA